MANITHIDHIAIAVKSIAKVQEFYEKALGLKISSIEEMPKRGIRTAFITIGLSKIELIEPLNSDSEISSFLEKRGPGLHHIALSTSNINDTQVQIKKTQAKLTYEQAQKGAHDSQINFIHPKSSDGVLIEIVENKKR